MSTSTINAHLGHHESDITTQREASFQLGYLGKNPNMLLLFGEGGGVEWHQGEWHINMHISPTTFAPNLIS
jgi:hypothetical protein